MWNIALEVELAFLFLGRGWQRHYPEHTRADAFGQGLDGTPFTGAVAPFKDDAHFQALADHPPLQLNQLHMQAVQLFFVLRALKRGGGAIFVTGLLFFLSLSAMMPSFTG
ncbi:Uncharacterised protein [Leclercia adecarboxylata]|uniref:Uncharacterized protein n=1 Tax=Leclercia adecarboxylata TaxID=83655 RepID=A0A4U9HV00_9ENTR|nr:Uncharacterised protein [Leclercia adecarboxylata]